MLTGGLRLSPPDPLLTGSYACAPRTLRGGPQPPSRRFAIFRRRFGYATLAAVYLALAVGVAWVLLRLHRAPLDQDASPQAATEPA